MGEGSRVRGSKASFSIYEAILTNPGSVHDAHTQTNNTQAQVYIDTKWRACIMPFGGVVIE